MESDTTLQPQAGLYAGTTIRVKGKTSGTKSKNLAKSILKFINYAKEAFMLPFNLIAFGIGSAIAVAAVIAAPIFLGIDLSGLLFILGGLELLYLGTMIRSKRFTTAINAKYRNELDDYYALKEIVETFNSLSAPAQRRFESHRKLLMKVRENYAQLNSPFPEIIRQYLRRIDQLQLSYVRMLNSEDKFQLNITEQENPRVWLAQIEGIRKGMAEDSDRVKKLKENRIKLLEQRIQNYNRQIEARKEIGQQIHAIEEMIKYFHDTPITREESLQTSQAVQDLIDETSELHGTIFDLEQAMSTEIASLESSEGSGMDLSQRIR